MKKSLFPVLLAIVMSTGCTSFERRVTQSAEAMNSWANNDYVSCVNKSRNVIALALEEQTDHFRARALLGWCELALGHLDEAETAFDELGRLSPANFEAMLGSAWVKLARRQLTQAEIALKESARWASGAYLSPQQSAEGWLAFYQGKLDLAEERFRAAERDLFHENYTTTHVDHGVKRNWSTQPWVGLGWVEMYRGRPEASRKAFLKGLDRDPNCHDCYGGLARLYMGLGQRTQAFKFATKGLSLTRHDPALLEFVNDILFDAKTPQLNVELYEYLVEKSNGDPLYLANLGYARYDNGDLNGAELAFETALIVNPEEHLANTGLDFVRCLKAGGDTTRCGARKK